MLVNMNDRYIRHERVPASIAAAGTAIRDRYDLEAAAVGIRGNHFHSNGYHRSWNWLMHSTDPANTRRGGDYSVQGDLNQPADPDACCALDVSLSTTRMREVTARVQAAALARDPRLSSWREFAGTLDGRSVVRIRCSDGQRLTPFDASHLWHFHASAFRARALRDHAGFVAVILGAGPPPAPEPTLEDDMQWTLVQVGDDGPVFLSNLMHRRLIPNWEGPNSVAAVKFIASQLGVDLRNGGELWKTDEAGIVDFGVLDPVSPAAILTAEERAELNAAITAALPAGLTPQQVQAVIDAAS